MTHRPAPAFPTLLLLLTPLTSVMAAQEEKSFCLFPPGLARLDVPQAEGSEVTLLGTSGEGTLSEQYTFRGDVRLIREGQYVEADEAVYDSPTQHLDARGNIHFQTKDVIIKGDRAAIDFSDDSGEVNQAHYYFLDKGFRGVAESFKYRQQFIELRDATYTTCDNGPSQWQLSAGHLTLDQANNEGTATNVNLQVKRVPILYFPYVSFPLEGRKSGFLPPSIGSTDAHGTDIALPYYLNLAPNYDATLTPRWMEKRGGQIGTEFRYLSHEQRGELGAEFLPDDRPTQKDRSFAQLRHNAQIGKRSQIDTRLAYASDRDYFRDLGTTLNTASRSQLERTVTVQTYGEHWQLSTMAQEYQILAPGSPPYRRLPQINANSGTALGPWQLGVSGEYTRFHHDTQVNGERAWLQPSLSYAWRKPWGYSLPTLAMRSVFYQLPQGHTASQSQANIPSFLWDSGLYFDRFDPDRVTALEPRLTLLYVPAVEQAGLPLFDTGINDPNLYQLFRRERYGGNDRIGDDRRITFALTGRRFNATAGRETFNGTLAHAVHFAPEQVTLPNESPFATGDSQTGLTLLWSYSRWGKFKASALRDSRYHALEKSGTEWIYDQGYRAASLGYFSRRGGVELASAAGYFSLDTSWRVAASVGYNLRAEQATESAAGLEYNGCCWRVRTLAREYRLDSAARPHTSFMIEVEFKGLSTVGQHIEERFFTDIQGYQQVN